MKRNELFLLMMDCLGKTQVEVAKAIGMKQQPLQRFLVGKGSISQQSRKRLAGYLGMSEEEGPLINPFGRNGFWKLYVSDRRSPLLSFESLEPLFSVVWNIKESRVIFLKAELESLERFEKGNPYETPVHAILIKDADNNIFLIRKKKADGFMLLQTVTTELFGRLFKLAREESRSLAVNVASLNLPREIYGKIMNDWGSVSRADMEGLFDLAIYETAVDVTKEERDFIKNLRSRNLELVSEEELIMLAEIKRKSLHPFDVLKKIKE